ncbi:MAG: hypothetical protein GWN29_03620 [Gammaproteobacteria bacterium]|nr:hypothetical protein [Gammaproteobacteria bacterium]
MVRYECSDLVEHRRRERVFERKPATLLLRARTEIAVNRAIEERGTLGYARDLLVDDQCGRSLDAPYRLHRKLAQMRGSAFLPPTLET